MRSIHAVPRAARTTSSRRRQPSRGQSLVEFALILPILLMLVGGIVQYGMIFATKHSLIQVARDVGRWAATQGDVPCNAAATGSPPQPLTQAHVIAQESRLMGYGSTGAVWDSTNFTAYADNSTIPSSPPSTQAVEVVWTNTGADPCPPIDSTDTAWVTVRLTHRAPVVLPGFPYLPGLGTCDSSGCFFVVSTTAEFRMEPKAGP